jgi:hypothetical protein
MERGKRTGNTGKPAANAAGREKGNTHGGQRGRRGDGRAAVEVNSGGGNDQDWGTTGIGGVYKAAAFTVG